jgi:HK97 gp10 family phage protein
MASDSGMARLQARLAAVPKAVREAVQPTLQRNGKALADEMKHLAPVDTGALRESIVMTPGGASTPPYSEPGGSQTVPDNAVMITAGNTEVRYAHLVEYGTKTAHAEPFFWPAYRLMRKKIQGSIKRAIGKAVRTGWHQ